MSWGGENRNELRTRLIWAMLRSHGLSDALSRLEAEGQAITPSVRTKIEHLQTLDSLSEDHFATLQEISASEGPEWASFAALISLSRYGATSRMEQYAGFERACSELKLTQFVLQCVRVSQCYQAIQSRNLKMAELYHAQAVECSKILDDDLVTISKPLLLRSKGLVAQNLGDYATANVAFRNALRESRAASLTIAPLVATELGTIQWASGQFTDALEIHTDQAHRAGLARLGPEWLIRSHLSAAKCAIDLNELTIAEQELRAAGQLIRESEQVSELVRGYHDLYRGELTLLAGGQDSQRGFDLLESACDRFEGMDPPFHAGLLDAKISITQYAIRTDDHVRMLQVLHNILAEAESNGCLEARARCMVLESSLFVSENPPLREAFDNLITRLHLINNPALLLQALGNLFIYSLRHLEQPDQAFLMGRLRNLQRVLEESCFQDLYERYIEQHYSWAIESRLAEFLERDNELTRDDESEPTL